MRTNAHRALCIFRLQRLERMRYAADGPDKMGNALRESVSRAV